MPAETLERVRGQASAGMAPETGALYQPARQGPPGRGQPATRYSKCQEGSFIERQEGRGREPPLRARGALRARRHQRRRRSGAGREPALLRPRLRRQQERGGAGGGARRSQGADHEGGAAAGHHPRGAASRIRPGAVPAAVAGPAHGPRVRAPPHDGRAGARLGGPLQELRAAARGLCLAGSGAPGDRPRRGRRSPPSCSIPTCSRPWRRTSPSSRWCSPCTRA